MTAFFRLILLLPLFVTNVAHAKALCELAVKGYLRVDLTRDEFTLEQELSYGVYKIKTEAGAEFVVRLADDSSKTDFEEFATQVYNSAPGVFTPPTRRLSTAEMQRLQRILPGNQGSLSQRASIADFIDGKVGAEYLVDINFSFFPHMLLIDRSGDLDYYRQRWSELSRERRQKLTDALRDWSGTSNPNLLLEYLISNRSDFTDQQIGQMNQAILSLIPAGVMTQIADAWALYTVLGVADFHASNWLMSGTQVVGIDLANPSWELYPNANTILELPIHQIPFSNGWYTNNIYDYLLKHVSFNMVQFLRNLKFEDLAKIRRNYELPDSILRSMVARAHAIANFDRNLNYPASVPAP